MRKALRTVVFLRPSILVVEDRVTLASAGTDVAWAAREMDARMQPVAIIVPPKVVQTGGIHPTVGGAVSPASAGWWPQPGLCRQAYAALQKYRLEKLAYQATVALRTGAEAKENWAFPFPADKDQSSPKAGSLASPSLGRLNLQTRGGRRVRSMECNSETCSKG